MTSEPPTNGSRPKHNGTRPRINWTAARAYFAALPEEKRTFKAVADRFRVSDVRVSQVAKRDRWLEEAQRMDERTHRLAMTQIVRNRADRLARTLELYDRAADLTLTMLPLKPDGTLDLAAIKELPRIDQMLEKIPGLFRMAELAAGEATDRVSLADVQPVLIAFARIAVVHASPESRGDVVRELEAASSGLMQLDSPT